MTATGIDSTQQLPKMTIINRMSSFTFRVVGLLLMADSYNFKINIVFLLIVVQLWDFLLRVGPIFSFLFGYQVSLNCVIMACSGMIRERALRDANLDLLQLEAQKKKKKGWIALY